MEVLEWIAKYWINWLCVLVAGGVSLFAKHYVKLQKQALENKWKEKEKNMCGKIITTIEEEIKRVEENSATEDIKIHKELDNVHKDVDNMTHGILSIQGKQFRDYCENLLEAGHYITVDEYEEFESEYEVYKQLGGNHRGDSLHDRVVDKVKAQMKAASDKFEFGE